jgi:hypothetical protein
MAYQVSMLWDVYCPHPAFADLDQAIAYSKGLLAQLPDDAHPETEVIVSDENGVVAFHFTLIAWRFASMITQDA